MFTHRAIAFLFAACVGNGCADLSQHLWGQHSAAEQTSREALQQMVQTVCYEYGRHQCTHSQNIHNREFWGCGALANDPAYPADALFRCAVDSTFPSMDDADSAFEPSMLDFSNPEYALLETVWAMARAGAETWRTTSNQNTRSKILAYVGTTEAQIKTQISFRNPQVWQLEDTSILPAIVRETQKIHGQFWQWDEFTQHISGFSQTLVDSHTDHWEDELVEQSLLSKPRLEDAPSFVEQRVFWSSMALAMALTIGGEQTNPIGVREDCKSQIVYNDWASHLPLPEEGASVRALALHGSARWTAFHTELSRWYHGTPTTMFGQGSPLEAKFYGCKSCEEILSKTGSYALPNEISFLEHGVKRTETGEIVQKEFAAFVFVCASSKKVLVKPTTITWKPMHEGQSLSLLVINVSPNASYPTKPLTAFGLANPSQASAIWTTQSLAQNSTSAFPRYGIPPNTIDHSPYAIHIAPSFANAVWIHIPRELHTNLSALQFGAGSVDSFSPKAPSGWFSGWLNPWWKSPWSKISFRAAD